MEAKTAYLALGANVGDRRANLRAALRLLDAGGCRVTKASSLYSTRPVGVEDQPDFLNAVIEVSTTLSPVDLLDLCNAIENEMGRQRTIRWGPRVIDIDILLYEGAAVDSDGLTIPHPRMMERSFVLVPLAEIAPDALVPGGMTAREAADSVGRDGIELFEDESWSK